MQSDWFLKPVFEDFLARAPQKRPTGWKDSGREEGRTALEGSEERAIREEMQYERTDFIILSNDIL